MRQTMVSIVLITSLICPLASFAQSDKTVAVIGTGDMGDSLGPKLAEIGYRVVYGSRDPSRESVRQLVLETGSDASATTQKDAAQSASIVLLAVGWPAMEQVAQGLGDLEGKIVIDVSFPFEQGEDGYPQSTVETRTAHWENVTARSSYWSCFWGDDWSVPIADAHDLAQFPDDGEPLKECADYPSDR